MNKSLMNVMNRGLVMVIAGCLLVVGVSGNAFAQVLTDAVPTITLVVENGESGVAYHPEFGYYYAAEIGNLDRPAWVFDIDGNLIHTEDPINIDIRSLNYNPNTGLMEAVSYNALNGGTDRGLINAELDGSGLFTAGTATLLATMPGNLSSQTMPAYDAARDRFYSRDNSNSVNIVDRSDGSLLGNITLDFATAGAGSVTEYAIGYAPSQDWLIVTDDTNNTAVVFDINGDYVGTSNLTGDVPEDYDMGFANNQLFFYDSSSDFYRGFDIGAGAPERPGAAEAIPSLTAFGTLLLALGILLLAARSRSRVSTVRE